MVFYFTKFLLLSLLVTSTWSGGFTAEKWLDRFFGEQISYHVGDIDPKLLYSDELKQQFIQSQTPIISLGYSSEVIWYRFTITNGELSSKTYFLLTANSGYRSLDMYINGVIVDSLGQNPPLEQHFLTFTLDSQKPTTVYLRAANEGARLLTWKLYDNPVSLEKALASNRQEAAAPGDSWQSIEEGTHRIDGDLPINPSGGLIGAGHPVGATGVRMAFDCFKQLTGQAGDYQIANCQKAAFLNIGGSFTTTVAAVLTAYQ